MMRSDFEKPRQRPRSAIKSASPFVKFSKELSSKVLPILEQTQNSFSDLLTKTDKRRKYFRIQALS
jgi:hypothetical protein